MTTTSRSHGTLALLVTALAGTGGCAMQVGEEAPDVAVTEQAVLNGTATTPSTFRAVRVDTGCSGTLINQEWVVSASHCFADKDPASHTVTYEDDGYTGTQTVAVDQIIHHPEAVKWQGDEVTNVDVVLLHLAQPILWWGYSSYETPIHPGPTTTMIASDMVCGGYGAMATGGSCNATTPCPAGQFCKMYGTSGTCMTPSAVFRTGWFDAIPDTDSSGKVRSQDHFQLDVPNSQGQAILPGDSGGTCWNGSSITGVHKSGNGAGTYNRETSSAAFWELAVDKRACTNRKGGIYDPNAWSWSYCDPYCPCDMGEGDCDSHADCLPGLICGQNVGAQYGLAASADLCVAPSFCPDFNPASPDPNLCTNPLCRCGVGEGDCDDDFECGGTMLCRHDIGYAVGLPDHYDVCTYGPAPGCKPYDPSGADTEFCSAACPCDLGEGDCDSNAECRGGLVCGKDNGAHFGKPAHWDFCVRP